MVRGTSTIPPPNNHTPTKIGARRQAFAIDRFIRAGIDGQPTFWTAGAGEEISTFHRASARTCAESAYPGTDHVTPIEA